MRKIPVAVRNFAVNGRRSVLTYMTCNQVEFVFWLVQHLAGLAQEVQVACAMEAVLAHGVLFVQLVRQGVHVGMSRHTLVERCVKDCNLHRHHRLY